MSVDVSARPHALATAIERACRHLLGVQDSAGWWKGELESNVTIEAEDLFLRRYLGILDSGTAERTARWIRSRQLADGTWDEEFYTLTGFPGAFYIRYHLYRLVFPLMALGRYAKKVGRDEDGM